MAELLKSYFAQREHTPFYISLAGVTYPDNSYRISRDKGELLVVEYVLSGQGYVLINGEILKVSRGHCYICPFGERHFYFSDKKDPYKKIFLNVRGKFAKELIGNYGIEGAGIFLIPKLEIIFKRIPEIIASNMPEDEIQAALQGVLSEILATISFAYGKSQYSAEALKLREYIDSNTDKLISSKELATLIFRSPDYCQKLFLREFKLTPYAYQLERKMQNAKSLLLNTKMTVGEIGSALGYNDAHYFSNLFKAKCGCPPSHYRKKGTAQ